MYVENWRSGRWYVIPFTTIGIRAENTFFNVDALRVSKVNVFDESSFFIPKLNEFFDPMNKMINGFVGIQNADNAQ